jgi:hypothetical protein
MAASSWPESSGKAAIAHRLAAMMIFHQIASGNFQANLYALRIVINELPADSPARSLLARDGSGFDRVVEIVERIPGVRFGELFSRLPTTRAADGPIVLAAVLAQVAEQPEAGNDQMPPELAALLAPLLAAAEAGEDIEPHLAALEQQLRQADPDNGDAVTGFIQQLREQLGKGEH